MSVQPNVKYVKTGGSMIAKPVSVRVSGSWTAIQDVPDAPTTIAADPGDSQAGVTWVGPANTGGIPIVSYTATSSPGNKTGTAACPYVVVGGLTNTTSYTFTVKATNAVGNSVASSASTGVTPATLTGQLYVTPASGTYNVGDTITMTIREDSLSTPVNALQADLTYDVTALTYVSANVSASPFSTALQNTGGSGNINIGLANLIGSSTGDQLVGVVTFTALKAGAFAVVFANTSGIARTSDSSNTCNQKVGGSYTVT